MHRPCVLGLALLAACGAAPEQTPADGDTLLFFTACPRSSPNEPDSLCVVPIEADVGARVVWRANANVLTRLDHDRVLLDTHDGLVVFDLVNGAHRRLAERGDFVAVHGDEVLYQGEHRHDTDDRFLYAAPWASDGPRRRLADARFAQVLLLAGDRAFAVTDANEVWEVDVRAAAGRAVWRESPPAEQLLVTLDSGRLLDIAYQYGVRVALAPNGRLLAIGYGSPNRETGTLTVVDVPSATVVRRWTNLPIAVSHFSSDSPTVEVGWYDDETVACSETRGEPPLVPEFNSDGTSRDALDTHGGFVFVLRSLASGAITSEMRYGRIGIRHHTPPPPGPQPPAREATFSTDEVGDSIRLLRAGCTEPLATVTNGADVNIAPDGQSAFVCVDVGSQSRTVLFTAAHAEGRLLCDHWANDPVWLRIGDTTNLWRGASSRCKVIPSEPCGTH